MQAILTITYDIIVRFYAAIRNLIYENICIICARSATGEIPLCESCFRGLDFEIPLYLCQRCGFPLPANEENQESETLCIACHENEPSFDGSFACLAYDELARDLILMFKMNDALYLRPLLTYFLGLSAPRLPDNIDLIVPVPLHPIRLWQRRYNQSALLAQNFAKMLESDSCEVNLLRRVRHTKKQKGSPTERMENLRNAFAVPKKYHPKIKGRHILLIDDVLTSGATLEHAARVLKKAGAKTVYGLAVARVVSPRPIIKRRKSRAKSQAKSRAKSRAKIASASASAGK